MYSPCALLTCLLYSSCQQILTQPAQGSYAGCVKIISSYLKKWQIYGIFSVWPYLLNRVVFVGGYCKYNSGWSFKSHYFAKVEDLAVLHAIKLQEIGMVNLDSEQKWVDTFRINFQILVTLSTPLILKSCLKIYLGNTIGTFF